MLVWSGYTVALPVTSVSIHSLYRPQTLAWCIRTRKGILAELYMSVGEILSDLDLDIAQITLTRSPLAFLLIWVVRLGCSWWATFHAAIPVVGDEGFSFVALRRAMRIDVV